jgi:alkylated DNA nucleotide flippase Atl1
MSRVLDTLNSTGQFCVRVVDATGKDNVKEYKVEEGIQMIEAEGVVVLRRC